MSTTFRRTGLVATTVAAAAVLLSTTPAHAASSSQLIKNPSAEAGPSSSTGGDVAVKYWTEETGSATAVKYGAAGFPSASTPGPGSRGNDFFAGGPADGYGTHVLTQTISLSAYAGKIASGKVDVALSGWFGGKGAINDQAAVELIWKDANGAVVGDSVTLSPVSAADRGNTTKLLQRTAKADVPAQARSAYVQLIFMDSNGGYVDAYADKLSLKLVNV